MEISHLTKRTFKVNGHHLNRYLRGKFEKEKEVILLQSKGNLAKRLHRSKDVKRSTSWEVTHV